MTAKLKHECKVIPRFGEHGKVDSFMWYECPDCGMKYASEDVDIPDDWVVAFTETIA